MSIYCSTFGFTAYHYGGSHLMPSRKDERLDVDVAYPASHIPTTLERARGRDYIKAREDGAPGHPWLRFSVMGAESDCGFVVHAAEVRDLVEFLNRWLERPLLTRTG